MIRKTITATFLDRVKKQPQKAVFQYKAQGKWKEVSYLAFYEEMRRISSGLINLGIAAGEKVAILSSTRYEWSLCDMAVLGARGVTVPIYASSTADDIAYILNHSEAKIVFVEDAKQLQKILGVRLTHADAFPFLKNIVVLEPTAISITLDDPARSKDVLTLQALIEIGRREEAREPTRVEQNLADASPSDLFTICYTSGTTGAPKGVLLTHDSLMSSLEDSALMVKDLLQGEKEKILSFLPFSHITGRVESMTPHVFGWTEAFVENLDSVILNMTEVKPTLIFCVPRILEKAYEKIQSTVAEGSSAQRTLFARGFAAGRKYFTAINSGKRPSLIATAQYRLAYAAIFSKIAVQFGGRLRFAVSGGAPLPKEIGEFFQVLGITVVEGYGLTETCAPISLNPPGRPKFGTVGKPLPEVNLKIADDGEILVQSRKVFQGYYKMPEETAAVLQDGWFHTGDVGQIDSEGYLQITDRKKDLIVTSGGKKIAPQKLENLVKAHRLISQLVVYGDRRNFITALVTLDHAEVIRYASENQILFSAYGELIKNSKIISLVQKVIEDVNKKLASFESIKKFLIVSEEFSVESGELTPSLKVKRSVIARRYRESLDLLYQEPAPTP